MEEEEKNLTSGETGAPAETPNPEKKNRSVSLRLAIPVLCLVLVASILLTWTFTSLAAQKTRLSELDSQKNYYESLIAANKNEKGDAFAILDAMLKAFSLYADDLDEKAMKMLAVYLGRKAGIDMDLYKVDGVEVVDATDGTNDALFILNYNDHSVIVSMEQSYENMITHETVENVVELKPYDVAILKEAN